jgi:hypothetical protein
MASGVNTRTATERAAEMLGTPVSTRRVLQLVGDGLVPRPERNCSGGYEWSGRDIRNLADALRKIRAGRARRKAGAAR